MSENSGWAFAGLASSPRVQVDCLSAGSASKCAWNSADSKLPAASTAKGKIPRSRRHRKRAEPGAQQSEHRIHGGRDIAFEKVDELSGERRTGDNLRGRNALWFPVPRPSGSPNRCKSRKRPGYRSFGGKPRSRCAPAKLQAATQSPVNSCLSNPLTANPVSEG